MLKLAIVDDEPLICEQLAQWVRKVQPDCYLRSYADGETFLADGEYFDGVFLDIKMSGADGLSVARKLRQKQMETLIVFVTGLKERVFEAFDVAAFHYLLKPLDEEKFAAVLARIIDTVAKRQYQEMFIAQTKKRSWTLAKKDILYVESHGKKADIHTTQAVITIYDSLKSLHTQLGADFYRSHRCYLVGFAHIVTYDHDSLTLDNGETIYLAKEKYTDFVKTYLRYLRREGGG